MALPALRTLYICIYLYIVTVTSWRHVKGFKNGLCWTRDIFARSKGTFMGFASVLPVWEGRHWLRCTGVVQATTLALD